MGAEDVSKKSEFSGRHISFSSPSYRTRHGEISLKLGFYTYVCLGSGLYKIIKFTDRLTAAEGLFLLTAKETKLPAR